MTARNSGRFLYRREELPELMELTEEQIQRLERTGQLSALLISGEERFDAEEIRALISTYRQIAQRKRRNT
jgi:hypothetical protein